MIVSRWITERRQLVALGLLMLCAGPGCSGAPDGPQRIPVSGTVKREGHLVDSGSIIFRSDSSAGGVNVSAGGEISNGHYGFTDEDGPPVGKYKVEIVMYPKYDPSYVGKKNEAPILPDDRFKKEMPVNGWVKEAEVTDQEETPVIDFDVE
jgi:hypothetical protein